jgi:RNA polymerase sigma factor (sigma-70 family)
MVSSLREFLLLSMVMNLLSYLEVEANLLINNLNVSRNYISRTRLHTISLALVEDVDQLEQDEDWHRQPELVAESAERRRELEAMVATLAPCYRDAISLCYFGDLTYQETATILNKSIGTIKFYVHRGIALLRKGQQSQMNEVRLT